MTTLDNPRAISLFRLSVAVRGLETHIKFNGRMRISRIATPKLCMGIVSEFTNKQYKRNQASVAAQDGRDYLRLQGVGA